MQRRHHLMCALFMQPFLVRFSPGLHGFLTGFFVVSIFRGTCIVTTVDGNAAWLSAKLVEYGPMLLLPTSVSFVLSPPRDAVLDRATIAKMATANL